MVSDVLEYFNQKERKRITTGYNDLTVPAQEFAISRADTTLLSEVRYHTDSRLRHSISRNVVWNGSIWRFLQANNSGRLIVVGSPEATDLPVLTSRSWTLSSTTDSVAATSSTVLTAVANTTVALAGSAVFTSAAFATTNNAKITVWCDTDAAGTLAVQQSPDAANWRSTRAIGVVANQGNPLEVDVVTPNARIILTNGAAAQTFLRLYWYLKSV